MVGSQPSNKIARTNPLLVRALAMAGMDLQCIRDGVGGAPAVDKPKSSHMVTTVSFSRR
jgi:hypothetical protein